jgi:hypothetical protein
VLVEVVEHDRLELDLHFLEASVRRFVLLAQLGPCIAHVDMGLGDLTKVDLGGFHHYVL